VARVLISLPDEFLVKVDELAKKEDRSRSELIREALRYYEKKDK
jgi:CopG family transcriptional regulator/antitoxin EndoAI